MTDKILTQDRLKELLLYCPNTGIFTRKIKIARYLKGSVAGATATTHGGKTYRLIQVDKKSYCAHRLAWLYMTGEWPQYHIDHIDGNGTNNAFANLRDVTQSENQKNKRMHKDNTSGVTGVCWLKRDNIWQASIASEGKMIHLGGYRNLFDAVCARKSAEIKYGFHVNHGSVRPL